MKPLSPLLVSFPLVKLAAILSVHGMIIPKDAPSSPKKNSSQSQGLREAHHLSDALPPQEQYQRVLTVDRRSLPPFPLIPIPPKTKFVTSFKGSRRHLVSGLAVVFALLTFGFEGLEDTYPLDPLSKGFDPPLPPGGGGGEEDEAMMDFVVNRRSEDRSDRVR